MPRKKKRIIELPTEQAIKKLFPKQIIKMVKKIAHEHDEEHPKHPQH